MAYNELYKLAEPGAMNLIMLETDGLPNTLVYNFYQTPGTTSTLALNTSSGCQDANNKTWNNNGWRTTGIGAAVDPINHHEYATAPDSWPMSRPARSAVFIRPTRRKAPI